MIILLLRFRAPIFALVLAGCASAGTRSNDPPDARSGVRMAALARISIENQTGQVLSLAFHAIAGGAEVTVGTIAGGTTGDPAPVLAGEPIVLVARSPDGAELRLAPFTFAPGQEWTWVIPAATLFMPTRSSP